MSQVICGCFLVRWCWSSWTVGRWTGDSYFYLQQLSATTSPVTRRRLIPGRLDRVQRCSLGEACDGCGALWLLVEHFVEQPPVELLALIRPRIMELVRLPCPATRIHQPDNSGHVTVGINWTAPQIEFWAKKEEQQNKKEMKHKMLESNFIMI